MKLWKPGFSSLGQHRLEDVVENNLKYDLSITEEAGEYLWFDTRNIEELLEKTSEIPASVITEELITEVVGSLLFVNRDISTEDLKTYASSLGHKPDWDLAIENALDVFSEARNDEGLDNIKKFYERIISVVPTYIVEKRFIEGAIRILYDSHEIYRLSEVLDYFGYTMITAFSEKGLPCFTVFDDQDRKCRAKIASKIAKYAFRQNMSKDELRAGLAPYWWKEVVLYGCNHYST